MDQPIKTYTFIEPQYFIPDLFFLLLFVGLETANRVRVKNLFLDIFSIFVIVLIGIHLFFALFKNGDMSYQWIEFRKKTFEIHSFDLKKCKMVTKTFNYDTLSEIKHFSYNDLEKNGEIYKKTGMSKGKLLVICRFFPIGRAYRYAAAGRHQSREVFFDFLKISTFDGQESFFCLSTIDLNELYDLFYVFANIRFYIETNFRGLNKRTKSIYIDNPYSSVPPSEEAINVANIINPLNRYVFVNYLFVAKKIRYV